MIRIRVDESTLARTRIAISPLNEVVAGLYLLHREPERVPWPYTGWAVRAREVLRTVPLTAPLRLYADLYGQEHARPTPDVFSPVPPSPRPSLADESAVLRRTPQALVAQQFAKHYPHGVPAFLAPYVQEPDRALSRLADGIATFWDLAFAPVLAGDAHGARGGGAAPGAGAGRRRAGRDTDRPARSGALGTAGVVPAEAGQLRRGGGRPATTTGLATEIGLAPSTVSEHLATLSAAGVVHRRRSGRHVLYGLEPAGVALLSVLGPGTAAGRPVRGLLDPGVEEFHHFGNAFVALLGSAFRGVDPA